MEDDRVNGMDDEDKEDEKEEGEVVERIIRHDKHVDDECGPKLGPMQCDNIKERQSKDADNREVYTVQQTN